MYSVKKFLFMWKIKRIKTSQNKLSICKLFCEIYFSGAFKFWINQLTLKNSEANYTGVFLSKTC